MIYSSLVEKVLEAREKAYSNNIVPHFLYLGRQQVQELKRILKMETFLECTFYGLKVVRVKLDYHLNVC